MKTTNPLFEQIENLPHNPGFQALLKALRAQEQAALDTLFVEKDSDLLGQELSLWKALKMINDTLSQNPLEILDIDFLDNVNDTIFTNKGTQTDAIGFPTENLEMDGDE